MFSVDSLKPLWRSATYCSVWCRLDVCGNMYGAIENITLNVLFSENMKCSELKSISNKYTRRST